MYGDKKNIIFSENTAAGDKRICTQEETGGQRRVEAQQDRRQEDREQTDRSGSVHLKLEQRSHRFFQVGGFLFLFFALPFQLR